MSANARSAFPVLADGYIYYSVETEGGGALYRMRSDGTDAEQIAPNAAIWLSVANDRVYFVDLEFAEMYSMNLDGSDMSPILSQPYDARGEALEFGEGSVCVYVTSDDRMAAYKLLRVEHDGSLTEARSCLLEPNQHAYLYVSPGSYVLKTAEGNTWISDDQAFGSSGHYTTTEPTELTGGHAIASVPAHKATSTATHPPDLRIHDMRGVSSIMVTLFKAHPRIAQRWLVARYIKLQHDVNDL